MTQSIFTVQDQILDAIAKRIYGQEHGTTEAILRANPGMAALGPVLPQTYQVMLPVLPPAAPPAAASLDLWA